MKKTIVLNAVVAFTVTAMFGCEEQESPNLEGAIQTSGIVFNENLSYGQVTDCLGNVYPTIQIGDQEWMAENLRSTCYQNGDQIPQITDSTDWTDDTSGGWCFYLNDPSYENPYGKLYNWWVAADERNPCPNGWHVPDSTDLAELYQTLNGFSYVGGKIKEVGSHHWYYSPGNTELSTNSSGFTALPAGVRSSSGVFNSVTRISGFWSKEDTVAVLTAGDTQSAPAWRQNSQTGYCIRCIRD
jgi:uncharacterized protein (TIGR02145 family)